MIIIIIIKTNTKGEADFRWTIHDSIHACIPTHIHTHVIAIRLLRDIERERKRERTMCENGFHSMFPHGLCFVFWHVSE